MSSLTLWGLAYLLAGMAIIAAIRRRRTKRGEPQGPPWAENAAAVLMVMFWLPVVLVAFVMGFRAARRRQRGEG